MKLEFQNRWLRLLIELMPALPPMRRYRVQPARWEAQLARALRDRIAGQSRQGNTESAQ